MLSPHTTTNKCSCLSTLTDALSTLPFLFYKIEVVINISAANNKIVGEFQKIAPFGADNIEPLIALNSIRVLNFRSVGKEGKHFSFIATDESGSRLNCIANIFCSCLLFI